VKIAGFLEEAAQTIHYAMLRGEVASLPQEELDRSFDWYKMNYGQKKA